MTQDERSLPPTPEDPAADPADAAAPPSMNASDSSKEPQEIMTQEEIDAYIASVRAKEEKENQAQATDPSQASESPENQAPQTTDQADSSEIAQHEIDALLAQEQPASVPASLEQPEKDSAAVSQKDIDALIAQEQVKDRFNLKNNGPAAPSDDKTPDQKPGPLQDEKAAWAELNHDILSQEEINALLSSFKHGDQDQDMVVDDLNGKEEIGGSDSEEIIDVPPPKNHIERLAEKEENYYNRKKSATALLKALMQAEEERIRLLEAKKEKMINEDLFRRYEICRGDRTKVVVSISQNNAERYRSTHLGCCMHRR